MTCQTLREAIVDVARGVETAPGAVATVASHIQDCEACAALSERERQLSVGLRVLAASAASEQGSPGLKERLQTLFADRQLDATRTRVSVGTKPSARRAAVVRRSLAAAAAIVVAATWWTSREPEKPLSVKPAELAAAVPRGEQRVASLPAPEHVATRGRMSAARRQPSVRARPHPRLTVATGFVALPSAVGLPDFESGQIVRVEIPVASLPTYGLEIGPDARDVPVEADVLVGQDGQARAIRLVSSEVGGRR